jgi:hypothetical protein
MTVLVATVTDSEADVRWREWQAQGAKHDRRRTTRMRTLVLIVAAAFATWVAVLIA